LLEDFTGADFIKALLDTQRTREDFHKTFKFLLEISAKKSFSTKRRQFSQLFPPKSNLAYPELSLFGPQAKWFRAIENYFAVIGN